MKIDHFAYEVSDLEASIRFYTEKLGFKVSLGKMVDEKEHEAFAILELAGGKVELLQALSVDNTPQAFEPIPLRPHACPHLALGVDDFDATSGDAGTGRHPHSARAVGDRRCGKVDVRLRPRWECDRVLPGLRLSDKPQWVIVSPLRRMVMRQVAKELPCSKSHSGLPHPLFSPSRGKGDYCQYMNDP